MSRDAPPSGASLDLLDDVDPSSPHPFDADARYEDGGVLGRGGMGEVRAVWDRRLDREVAIKTLTAPTSAQEARLAREVWVTARLEHPGIVPVHDAGRRADGALFYTMRLVRGRSLAAAREDEAPTRLLRHVLDAAQAVAYAHSQGVVHRDLKPANVMVGPFGETLVVDWGLAAPHDVSALGVPGPGWPPLEEGHGVVGTPRYMSPEQARGEAPHPADDVYSLGVMLLELAGGAPDAARPLESVPEDAPGELVAIVARALGPTRRARYADAAGLVADLEAMFDGRRVGAYDYSPTELLLRLVRAWKAPLLVAAGATVLLGIVVGVAFVRTARERDRARAAEGEAVLARDAADDALARALVARALDAGAADQRAQAETLAAEALLMEASPEARGVLSRFASAARPRRQRSEELPFCTKRVLEDSGRFGVCLNAETVVALDLASDAPVIGEYRQEVVTAVPMVDGTVVTLEPPNSVRLWSPRTGAVTDLDEASPLLGLVSGPNPQQLAGIAGYGIYGLDRARGASTVGRVCITDKRVAGIVLGPRLAAVACVDGVVRGITIDELLDGGLGRDLVDAHASVTSLSFSQPEPDRLVVGTHDGRVLVVDVETGEQVAELQVAEQAIFAALLYGDRLATSGTGLEIQVRSLSTGIPEATLPQRGASISWLAADRLRVVGRHVDDWHLAQDPGLVTHRFGEGLSGVAVTDGVIAASLGSGEAVVRDERTGRERQRWDLGPSVAKDLAFSPDGRSLTVATVSHSALELMPDWRTGERVALPGSKHRRTLWVGDGLPVGVAYRGPPTVWRRDGGDWVPRALPFELVESADGERASDGSGGWILGRDGSLFEVPQGRPEDAHFVVKRPGAIAVAGPQGAPVIAFGDEWTVGVGDDVRRVSFGERARPVDVAVSPRGDVLAFGHLDGTITAWSWEGELLAVLRGHTTRAASVEFTADGCRLVSGSWDRTARIWGVAEWTRDADELHAEVTADWGLSQERALSR